MDPLLKLQPKHYTPCTEYKHDCERDAYSLVFEKLTNIIPSFGVITEELYNKFFFVCFLGTIVQVHYPIP